MLEIEIKYSDRTAKDLARQAIELTRGDKRKAIEVINILYGTGSRNIGSMAFCEQASEIIKNAMIK